MGGYHRFGSGSVGIHFGHLFGRIIRVVRAGKTDPGGEGFATILLEPGGGLVADKTVDVKFAIPRADRRA